MRSAQQFASHHSTTDGMVEDLTLESGVFTVSVAYAGYLSVEEDVTIDCQNIECQDCENKFTIKLDKISSTNTTDPVDPDNTNSTIPEVCDGATGTVTVLDYVTRQPINGATINVTLLLESEDGVETHDIVINKISNTEGKIEIPMTVNGNYQITVVKEDYLDMTLESQVSCHTDECDSCTLDVTAGMQPNTTTVCKDVEMTVYVKDEDDYALEGATVNVFVAGQSTPINGEGLVTNDDGEAFLNVMATGDLTVEVSAEGMFGQTVNKNFSCDATDCELCAPIVVFILEEQEELVTSSPGSNETETDEFCNDRESIILLTEAFDLMTSEAISTARINVTFTDVENEVHVLATDVYLNEIGQLPLEIKANGLYTAYAAADGYTSNKNEFVVSCDPDECGSCSASLNIPLEQEFCQETYLKVTVTDQETLAPVKDASVHISMKTGNTSQVVSNHLVCPEEKSIREECGYYGIQEEECQEKNCCWDASVDGDLFCFKKFEISDMKTDDLGFLLVPISGRGEFIVEIIKDGYTEYTGETPVYCPNGDDCELCNPTLAVALNQDFCDMTIEMNIQILDNNGEPVEGAAVDLILTSSVAEASATNVGGDLLTNANGTVNPQIYTSGSYMVSVTAAGFLPNSVEKEVEASTACENQNIPLTIRLANEPENSTETASCENTTMLIHVVDLVTGASIPEAQITMKLGDNVLAENVKTDANGNLELPAPINGDYEVTAAKDAYILAVSNKTIACSVASNCSCDTSLTLSLDQPRCSPTAGQSVVLPVIVKDNITNHLVEGALVTLVLTNSLSGPSMLPVDQPRYTDSTGTAQFTLKMNGDYSVSVTAQDYVSQELPVEVSCNPDHCQLCTPSASVTLNQEFCADKSMKMIIKDSLNNEAVVGAQVKVSLSTYEGAKEISSLTIGDSGVVDVPLVANGLYLTEVSMPGYVLAKSSFQVNMSAGECELYTPVELTPLSPTPPAECVRMSLTWGENPQDLDLFSYRVNKNETEDQCLTYYCDGKDPCNGTAFEVDNKSGGLNGSETISYCSTEEYTNMVYVDDLSGQGSSLLSSQARLIIVGSEETQEIVLNANDANQESNDRYWLAGCLTTTATGSFEFISVNQFMDVQPNVEEPMHCHSRVAVNDASYSPLKNASARIIVVDALTNEPLEGVMTSLTSESSSQTGLTGGDGIVAVPVNKNGEYSVSAEMDGYVPQQVSVNVDCIEINCKTDVFISMLPTNDDNRFQILLNWADNQEDLDLHVIQVDINDNRMTCETSFSNMNGCKDASLNHNIKQGGINGSETVTIKANSVFSYLVFADDNSLAGSSLGSSQAHITVTDGTNNVKDKIPEFTDDTVAGARYWLAGCLQIVGETFNYVHVNKFSRESPNVADKLFCDSLFKNNVETTPVEHFCQNIELNVAIHDSLTNDPVLNASATVILTKDGSEKLVLEGAVTDSSGKLMVPIKENGQYVVKVEGSGYVGAKKSLDVNCDISKCGDCEPSMLVPLSPLLSEGELRLTMSWGEKPKDLDIYAQQKDATNQESSCTTSFSKKNDCDGVTLDLDNMNGGNNGVETITFHDVENQQDNIYMIFVHHYGTNRVAEEFGSSSVQLTLTDGVVSTDVVMEEDGYNGEEHWLAGCIRIVGTSYEFAPVNVFLNSRPDEEVPNLCLETFGVEVTTEKSYSWYNPQRYYG